MIAEAEVPHGEPHDTPSLLGCYLMVSTLTYPVDLPFYLSLQLWQEGGHELCVQAMGTMLT